MHAPAGRARRGGGCVACFVLRRPRPRARGRAIQVYRYPTHSVTYRSIIVGATRNTDSKPRAAGRPFYRYLRRPRAGLPLPLHTRGSPTATAYPAPGADTRQPSPQRCLPCVYKENSSPRLATGRVTSRLHHIPQTKAAGPIYIPENIPEWANLAGPSIF